MLPPPGAPSRPDSAVSVENVGDRASGWPLHVRMASLETSKDLPCSPAEPLILFKDELHELLWRLVRA